MSAARASDPFTALDVPRQAGLTDSEVRAAWRRVAAGTHPDRADGGDPARFAAAAAAYSLLRTTAGRREALAAEGGGRERSGARPPLRTHLTGRSGAARQRTGPRPRAAAVISAPWSRLVRGRPVRLGLRIAAAVAASTGAWLVAGWHPATPALITGVLTWLVLTGRQDLAPPP